MAVTHYAHWICEIKMNGWLVLSRYNWLWTNLTCASDMLFDDEPALLMASVSSLPGWLELNMIHLPWGLLSAQRFFSTYLVVNHAAVTWTTTRHFPLTSVAQWVFSLSGTVLCEPWRRLCPCENPSRSAVCEISTLINFPPHSEDWCDLQQVIFTTSSFALPCGCLC